MMLRDLDTVLLRLFRDRIPELVSDLQVRFEPPNADWRTYLENLSIGGQPVLGLNIYLVELREDRELRSNERVRRSEHGVLVDEPTPGRVECHYLVSAWDPAQANQQVQPTPTEHALLYAALGVLTENAPINPSRVLANPTVVDELIREADLPTEIVPPDGFPKLPEFWGTMGQDAPWRPAIYLIVTLPVALRREVAGPMVTTSVTEYPAFAGDSGAEAWIQIGGRVLVATGAGDPAPVGDAWVRAETTDGVPVQTTRTSKLGRFTFVGLAAGRYRLRTRARGLGEKTRDVDVPAPTGEYDLRFP
jgi:hypothetical protein